MLTLRTIPTEFKVEVRAIMLSPTSEILLLQRASDESYMASFFEFPGGKVELGEYLKNSLRRETKEETSLTVTEASLFCETTFLRVKSSSIEQYISLHFLVNKYCGDVILSKEHRGYAWIGLNEAENLKLTSTTQFGLHCLRDYLRQGWRGNYEQTSYVQC